MGQQRAIGPVLVLLMGACRPDAATAPPPRVISEATTASSVYPAGQYKPITIAGEGYFSDISDANLIVGFMNDTAIAMPLHGTVVQLTTAPGYASRANGVNGRGGIVGSVIFGSVAAPVARPAYWPRVGLNPILLPHVGVAHEINDAGIAVGQIERRGRSYAYAWDVSGVTGKPLWFLPPLPGGRNTSAVAINADWIILGTSDGPAGWQSVVWQWNGSGWTPRAVNGGIFGNDIDSGFGIVGSTGSTASFGNPDHAGFFLTGASSMAWGVNARGVATGDAVAASTGWPQNTGAFVADRGGNVTFLPLPTVVFGFAWRATYGYGINTCGVVVGTAWGFPGHPYTAQPAIWDPGC
ncbi:MAG: hypothetical protein IT361_00200 [Gemmatimonadaceae bacterium]|nr:hypothetical protein [Gemmatimonadaceae bacterium]